MLNIKMLDILIDVRNVQKNENFSILYRIIKLIKIKNFEVK